MGWILPQELPALAPKAPVITRVHFSRAWQNSSGTPEVDTRHSYLVEWTDNSLDEEGFEVQAKVGSEPYVTIARMAANSNQVSLNGLPALSAGTDLLFQVLVWKFNGTRIESATSAAFTFKVPEGVGETALNSPNNLVVGNVVNDDSRVKLSWSDRSNSELYYQIDVKEASASTFQALTFVPLWSAPTSPANAKVEHTFRLRLVPNTDYQFRVRATRQASTSTTAASTYTATANLRSPPLAPPTNLSGQATRENQIRLTWKDNSNNETGYEIQYRDADDGAASFAVLGTTGESTTSVDIPVPQGSSIEWRVAALYTYTPSGSSTQTTLRSDVSNVVTLSTLFPPPTNVVATTSGVASTVDLTWEDNSSSEYGFNIYTRPQGTGTWHFARAVRDGVTKVSVNSRTESNDSTGKPIFIPLETNTTHEFMVRAVASDESNVSLDSNTATAAAQHGFTGRFYEPIQQGLAFNYTVATTNADNRTEWGVSNLPAALAFNSGSGVITGTPTEAGLFECTLTASFSNAPTATTKLMLRVLKATQGASGFPYVVRTIPGTRIGINTPFRIPLADKFADPDSEIAVQLETSLQDTFGKNRLIDIHLFPSLAPAAVANFLSYVNAGDYDGLAFHRLVSGFVLQAGSLKPVASPRTFVSVPQRAKTSNEPGISNVRGTLAAAKVGARNSTATLTSGTVLRDETFGYVGDPDSATTDFFINLVNNASNLDNQNGGFTAFGRVSSAGMTVVDSIASLPIGSYLNGNTTSNYDASLDKRIVLDGSLTPFSGIPMNAATAPADMDVNKTVRILKVSPIAPLRYTVTNSAPTVVTAVIEGSELKLTGLAVGVATIRVTAVDLDNNSSYQDISVAVEKGYRHPAITRHPVSLAVVAGSKATFSVTATGSSLSYQWRKRVGSGLPFNIDGATGPSLVISNVQAADQAVYDVLVSNDTTTLTSAPARLDLRAAPTVGTLQQSRVVEVGKPFSLTVNSVTGAPAPTFIWKRGTTTVAGQTGATLNIAAAKLTDAGIYSATATNAVGKAASGTVSVCVFSKAATRQVFTANRTITLTAPAAGPGMSYRWRRNSSEIPLNEARFSGMQEPALKITGTQLGDTASYTCMITLPDGLGTVETGAIDLFVVTRPVLPPLTDSNAPPPAYIGVDYNWTLPYATTASQTPTAFSTSGLPPGLRLNTSTGVISGRPTQIGQFKLTSTASNAAGASTPAAVGYLTVNPLPSANVGSFVATISPSSQLNGNKGGRMDLTVLDTAAYTARLILGTETISAAGSLGIGSALTGSGGLTYQSRIQLKRRDKSVLTLLFEIDPDQGYVTGIITNGTESSGVSGFRQFWDSRWNPCAYALAAGSFYNMALNLDDEDVGKANIPQGSGYLSMSVSSKGVGTLSGRLPDGTSVTGSSMIGPAGEALLFSMLYLNKGSILSQINIGDTALGTAGNTLLRVDGSLRWIKDAMAATERNYQPGFPSTTLIIQGASYSNPGTNKIIMGLPDTAGTGAANARIDFSQGGLDSASRNPDRAIRITTANGSVYPETNAASTSLAISAATGALSGSFLLNDNGVARTVTYLGLVIPAIPHTPAVTNTSGVILQNEIPGSGAFGAGYFLLPELLPSTTKSKINSGRMFLQGQPISITTQPQDQTVNPGANVTLTVAIAAGSQGTVTYRWRKNGNTIAGATTSTLNLGTIAEAGQGDYDCVVSNGSFTVTSEAATVSVNDPVTNVSISRSPSASVVASGTKVTYTATAQGTGPFLYQWKKDGVAIFDATSATYEIATPVVGDSGSYTVTISNAATPAGVTSTANSLTVATPVQVTSVSRSPDTSEVPSGTPVTFSVIATGTGPLTYQWRKNGVDIPSATSATYEIPSPVSGDSGDYTVLVKNIISTSGVPSGTVNLLVIDP